MGWADRAIAELTQQRDTTVIPHGHSMTPRIENGQHVFVRWFSQTDPLSKGDVVLVRVRGRVLLHLVTAIDGERVQIGNNHGRVNGWVRRTAIYGVADI